MKRVLSFIFFTLILATGFPASAQTPVQEGTQPPPSVAITTDQVAASPVPPPGDLPALGSGLPISGFDIIWNIGVFILVLALLYLVLKALGKVSRFKGTKNGRNGFALRGIQALDGRKYLAAVELEGRIIVVGVTADRITPVAHWFAGQYDDNEHSAGLDLDLPGSGGSELRLPDDEPSFDLGLAELSSSRRFQKSDPAGGPGLGKPKK